jgi:hypothetical protein
MNLVDRIRLIVRKVPYKAGAMTEDLYHNDLFAIRGYGETRRHEILERFQAILQDPRATGSLLPFADLEGHRFGELVTRMNQNGGEDLFQKLGPYTHLADAIAFSFSRVATDIPQSDVRPLMQLLPRDPVFLVVCRLMPWRIIDAAQCIYQRAIEEDKALVHSTFDAIFPPQKNDSVASPLASTGLRQAPLADSHAPMAHTMHQELELTQKPIEQTLKTIKKQIVLANLAWIVGLALMATSLFYDVPPPWVGLLCAGGRTLLAIRCCSGEEVVASGVGVQVMLAPRSICPATTCGSAQTLSRQAKLDVSCRVKVLVGKELTIHPYRVLRL